MSKANGASRYQVGVDIGGTFTDLVLVDTQSGSVAVGKTLTTPDDPATAVETGIRGLLSDASIDPAQIGNILHATTLATNAIIERKGAKTGLLTTEGHRDSLEIRDEGRYDLYDLFLENPKPLVPRRHRLGVKERVLADGSVYQPIDLDDARQKIKTLLDEGVEAIAVCFLHSYQNPAHERSVMPLIRQLAPNVKVSISSEVAPEIREYPRTSTTVTNVYVQDLVERYLTDLRERMRRLGLEGELLVMLSSGGMSNVETASKFPVRMIESGPAAGALMAAFYGKLLGRPNLIAFDMGGTTAKACLIEEGQLRHAREFEVDRVWRFKRGSGMPIKAPVIELIEIGAGGGSIAWIDRLGLLNVGPESAGAKPGPACYGLGGTHPTVTDADLVLGYLDPNFFLGGKMKLDPGAAKRAIEREVGAPLGLDVAQAAWGIHQMVNENMASAARMAAVERGRDPRGYPIFAFGGAGPVHAYGVARILHSREVVVPAGAGVASAGGLLSAPLSFDFVQSLPGRVDTMAWPTVHRLYEDLARSGREILAAAGVPAAASRVIRSADMRYVGQGYEITVTLPEGDIDVTMGPRLMAAFEATYAQLYGRTLQGVPVEIVNWRATVTGPTPELRPFAVTDASLGRQNGGAASARKGTRPAYFAQAKGFLETPVYDRYALRPHDALSGPAIVEERESTTIIGPGATLTLDESLNLVISLNEA
jgi:N-methylhydantoinase A